MLKMLFISLVCYICLSLFVLFKKKIFIAQVAQFSFMTKNSVLYLVFNREPNQMT